MPASQSASQASQPASQASQPANQPARNLTQKKPKNQKTQKTQKPKKPKKPKNVRAFCVEKYYFTIFENKKEIQKARAFFGFLFFWFFGCFLVFGWFCGFWGGVWSFGVYVSLHVSDIFHCFGAQTCAFVAQQTELARRARFRPLTGGGGGHLAPLSDGTGGGMGGGREGGSNGQVYCDSKFALVAFPLANPKGQRCVP